MNEYSNFSKFSKIRGDLAAGAQLPNEAARVEAGKRAAREITELLGSPAAKGLPVDVLAKRFGLGEYVIRMRGAVRFNLAAAVADVLKIPVGAVPPIERPQDVTEAVVEQVSEEPPIEEPHVVAEAVVKDVHEVFVPTTEKPRNFGTGDGVLEQKDTLPRLSLTSEVLAGLGVDLKTVPILKGSVTDEMMRKLPYYCFVVSSLNRMILVCEEEGNQTFVVFHGHNPERFYEMSKDELKSHDDVGFFKWNANTDVWKQKMHEHLTSATPIKEQRDTAELEASVSGVDRESESAITSMDSNYFKNIDNLKKDLEAFAADAGPDRSPLDFNTLILRKLFARCQNGQILCAYDYFLEAAVNLGLAKDKSEAYANMSGVLEILLEKAGYKLMNREYFENVSNLKGDLEAFAAKIGPDKSPLDINTRNLEGLSVKCQNGETLSGYGYVTRAAMKLDWVSDSAQVMTNLIAILALLCRMAGYEPIGRAVFDPSKVLKMNKTTFKNPEGVKMDKAYFENPENVKHDLNAFLVARYGINSGKSVLDFNNSDMKASYATCNNGDRISGLDYVLMASAALDLGEGRIDSLNNFSIIFNTLLEIAGYKIMDKKYFEDVNNVKKDLELFAAASGQNLSPLDLNVGKLRKPSIRCQNGETVSGITYLVRFGRKFGLMKDLYSQEDLPLVFQSLLEFAGYKIMNKDYFNDSENIRYDLGAFAAELGEDKSPLDLNTGNFNGLKAKCKNGQSMTCPIYLSRAGVALGFADTPSAAKNFDSKIFAVLFERAGYKMMNRKYFENSQNIRHDLEAFATALGVNKTYLDLNTSNMKSLKITASNGEEINGLKYLRIAGVALGYAKNQIEVGAIAADLLQYLKNQI